MRAVTRADRLPRPAGAAGDASARDRLLDEAQDLDARVPTYYGAARVALGRIMLQTDRLGRCDAP